MPTLALISDTHTPQRWPDVPPVLRRIFGDAELILHAGDVGALWVLEELSAIAPVVAVHGNDDSADSQRELPYQQLLTIDGTRILLWHSHFPDREEEMAFRQHDDWQPKLERELQRARRAGASIIIHGHTHIPMATRREGILIINPGAIASGNHFLRQTRQTVALLHLDQGHATVTHVDLAAPDQPFNPPIDWQNGFTATMAHYSESLLSPGLEPLVDQFRAAPLELRLSLLRALEPICHQCWANPPRRLTLQDIRQALQTAPDLTTPDRQTLLSILDNHPTTH
jgi:putative phosphoesterase